jgi:formylmethanofuran dehydrogenase subunit C
MSDAVTLTLAAVPTRPLVAACIAADRFAALDEAEIAALPVTHGGRPARLGDFFRVRGGRAATVRIEGDLTLVEGIGTGMAGGEVFIEGGVGRDLGVAMAGGRIDVGGDAGENAGGAPPGGARGMTGGEIVIHGSAGPRAGAAARRGLIVIAGTAGPGAGRGMIAGTVVVYGAAGPGAGRFLKRGSIVALGPIARPATFRYACTYRPPYLPLLFRYLERRYGLATPAGAFAGRYARYAGDMAELGKGEILHWVGE